MLHVDRNPGIGCGPHKVRRVSGELLDVPLVLVDAIDQILRKNHELINRRERFFKGRIYFEESNPRLSNINPIQKRDLMKGDQEVTFSEC